MSWHSFRPYVTAAERRAKAAKQAAKLFIKGQKLSPVQIKGRDIARTFWGKAWCSHLESFSDYENRLPRGRTYVRSGSVIDLQIASGKITAKVMGSSLYEINFSIAPLDESRWQAIKAECAGKIDSLVELLQGRLSSAVLRIITDRDKGLFPKPSEIEKTCSCPDWADLCKHLPQCCMEWAPGWTKSRSSSSCCAVWTISNSSEAQPKPAPLPRPVKARWPIPISPEFSESRSPRLRLRRTP